VPDGKIGVPFTLTELVGGYFMVEVPDYGAAVEIATECPAVRYASEIEIREVANICAEVAALRGH
jgi:hypothetical protein